MSKNPGTAGRFAKDTATISKSDEKWSEPAISTTAWWFLQYTTSVPFGYLTYSHGKSSL
jgi:hypothetical protein